MQDFHGDTLLPGKVAGFFSKRRTLLTTKYNKTMKELIDILTNEDKSFEGLPKWVYIFAVPAGLLLACIIGGTLS